MAEESTSTLEISGDDGDGRDSGESNHLSCEEESVDGLSLGVTTETTVSRECNTALFLLKLKEIHKVSQTAISAVVEDVNEIVQDRIMELEKSVLKILNNMNFFIAPGNAEVIQEIQDTFEQATVSPFTRSFASPHQQYQYYREFLGLIVCIKVHIQCRL